MVSCEEGSGKEMLCFPSAWICRVDVGLNGDEGMRVREEVVVVSVLAERRVLEESIEGVYFDVEGIDSKGM